MNIVRPEFFTGIELYILTTYHYACPMFRYTEHDENDPNSCCYILVIDDTGTLSLVHNEVPTIDGRVITMHIKTYGGTQFTVFTQGEIEGLLNSFNPWPEYVDARMGIMDWQHVNKIIDTIPCVNRDWITKVRNTTGVGRNITRIRDAKNSTRLHSSKQEGWSVHE